VRYHRCKPLISSKLVDLLPVELNFREAWKFGTPREPLLTLPLVARTSKNADDIVITLAIRTPLAKAKKGGFRDTTLEYMIYALLKEVRERSNIDPALVEDICMGNVRSVQSWLLS
jgi:hypothetical protein